jgi:hypothetical protein
MSINIIIIKAWSWEDDLFYNRESSIQTLQHFIVVISLFIIIPRNIKWFHIKFRSLS